MRKTFWLLSAGLTILAAPGFAQDTSPATTQEGPTDPAAVDAPPPEPTETQVEQAEEGAIVITATRRNEALSDVPLAVSAITAETLQNSGASDIRQIQQVSPSLLVSSTQSEAGASTARIRGIGTVGDNPGLESSVGIFIDGVYRSRVGAGLTELGQIDRVEVLRGPQGTLFGRNTSAGLIHVITAKPKFEPEAMGELTIGNYNMRRVELSGTGPITDTIAARIDGVYLKRDGFVEDLISGRDVNDRDRWLLRGQALFQPNDDFSLRLIADYSKRDEECCAAPYLPVSDAVGDGAGNAERAPSTFLPVMTALGGIVPDDSFDRDVVISPGRSYRGDVKDWGVSGEAVYDFGGAELTSITAYRDNDLVRGTDIDYSNLDLAYRPDDGTAFNRFKTFSQELRLQGELFNGRLDWLVGGYYANERLRSQDSLKYGSDFDALTSCLSASTFVALTAQPTLRQLSSPTCFNTPTATGVRAALVSQYNAALAAGNIAAATALGSQITTLAAFARLNNTGVAPGIPNINFTGPAFSNNGFENLIRATSPFTTFGLADTGVVDDFRQTSNNFAIFTHNIFEITERLKLTVGARYTTETKKLRSDLTDTGFTACSALSGTSLQQAVCAIPSAPGGFAEIDGKRTENKLSGTAVISFKPTDRLLTYASYSRGYKAGGFNLDRSALSRRIAPNSFGDPTAGAICPTTGALPAGCLEHASADQLEFKPEINDAFEIGAKYNGNGIDVNVAVFHQLFRDFQLNTFNGVNFIVENINSCSDDLDGADSDNNPNTGVCTGDTRPGVRSRGVEVEVFARPIRNINVNAGVTYSDTKYRDNLVGADGRALTNALFQLPGRRVSNSSAWTVTSSVAWTPPIGSSGMRGLVYLDMRHQSEFNTGSDLDLEKVENGYTVFNGRVGLRGPEDRWAVELWAQNLFNQDVYQIGFDAFLQGSCTERGAANGFCRPPLPPTRSNQLYGVFLGEPRTYGMTLRGKFGAPRRAPVVDLPPPPPPPAPPPAPTQTCPDGTVIEATGSCPLPPPPPPPPPEPERG